jgi:AmmeMemoRadiSam system protein B
MNAKTIDSGDIRAPSIAGTWYPGSRRELENTIDKLLLNVEARPNIEGELVALIAPHAGYSYSGQTAACSYYQLRDKKFDTVVLIGPSHYADFGPFAVTQKKFYATPLGEIELDQEFISALDSKISLNRVEYDREHSLEIQLPFLQRALGSFKLVPIMMSRPFYIVGAQAREYCNQLASALAEQRTDRHTLFVASSDLSHLEDYDAVRKFDARFAKLVEQFNVDLLTQYMVEGGECRACGDAPIISTMLTAQNLGADRARVLRLTNSGDVTGARTPGQYTVGYMAAAISKSKKS